MLEMAEGGPSRDSLTPAFFKGSEEIFDVACSPCARGGRNAEAVNFCANCSEFFCQECTNHHSKFGATAGHSVVGREEVEQTRIYKSTGPLPTETCCEHPGELLTTYCTDHDAVVCATCVTAEHRLCDDISHILNVSGDPAVRQNIPRVEDTMKDSLNNIDSTLAYVQKHKDRASEDKGKSLLNIRENTERLLDHTRDMERKAIDEVTRHHEDTTKALDTDIAALLETKTTIQKRLKGLGDPGGKSDSQIFVDLKKGMQEAKTTNTLQQHAKRTGAAIGRFAFVEDERVETHIREFSSIGKLVVNKPYKATLKGSYSIEKENERSSQILDICGLADGRILMTDFSNKRILALNQSYLVTKSFTTPRSPTGICQTSKHEIAVTLTYAKKVQFVDIRGSWKMTKSFPVEDRCRGIALSKEHLLVCCGGQAGTTGFAPEGPGLVAIYDMAGSLCYKIQLDRLGQQIFHLPTTIALTDDGNKIHVGNGNGSMTTVDGHGNLLSTFSRSDDCITSVCELDESNLVACGYKSNTIVQINKLGELVTEVLSHDDGLTKPVAIVFSRCQCTLVVAFDRSNEIKVFDLIQ